MTHKNWRRTGHRKVVLESPKMINRSDVIREKMKNLTFELSENFEIQQVKWKREFMRKIFKKNFASKIIPWRKATFPMSPVEDLFAGNSVQTLLHFHIPETPAMQEILIELQEAIYPRSAEELNLQSKATTATLKMIGKQSQALNLKGNYVSFFGHRRNFCSANRFTSIGSETWPFEFQRAKVRWEAHTNQDDADIILEIDFFLDLSKVETATWMEDGRVRIPPDDVELCFDLRWVINAEILPPLTKIENTEDSPANVSSASEESEVMIL